MSGLLPFKYDGSRRQTRSAIPYSHQSRFGRRVYFFLSWIVAVFNLFLNSLEKRFQFSGFVFSFGLLAFLLEVLRRDDGISHGEFSSTKEGLVYPIRRYLPIPGVPEILRIFWPKLVLAVRVK